MEPLAATIDRLFRRDPEFLADPSPVYRDLLAAAPVLRVDGPAQSPPWLNAWHVFAYDPVAAGLRDARLSSRRPMATIPLERLGIDPTTPEARFFWAMQAGTLLTMDAPDHTRLRRLAMAAFTPRVVEQLRDDIQVITASLLDAADARRGHHAGFDLMAALAAPLPAMVIAQLLGIPAADWARFKRWSDGLIGFNVTPQKLVNFYELGQYLLAQIAARREQPRDDLISAMIAARDQDDALTEEELVAQCIVLLVGGHETTTFALGNAVYRLLENPERWDSLPDVPLESAVDELLRYDSPFQALSRRATAEVQLGGETIGSGDTVWLWIAAANHDPAAYSAPGTIDLGRQDNRHLSFGRGPHFCLGAALARLELQTAIAVLRERYPALRLPANGIEWKRDSAIRGPASLHLAVG